MGSKKREMASKKKDKEAEEEEVWTLPGTTPRTPRMRWTSTPRGRQSLQRCVRFSRRSSNPHGTSWPAATLAPLYVPVESLPLLLEAPNPLPGDEDCVEAAWDCAVLHLVTSESRMAHIGAQTHF